MVQKFDLKFIESVKLSENTYHMIFEHESDAPFLFIPGQFISFHFDVDGKDIKRNYSLANSPSQDSNRLEIAISYVEGGLASTKMSELKSQDTLVASGPYGIFTLKDDSNKRYIFMGTGTGITPYRSMLPALDKLLATTDRKIVLLQGVRAREEALYSNEFIEFAANHPGFSYQICYSREFPTDNKEYEFKGYIQDRLIDLDIKPQEDIAYLCGNPNMVDDSFAKFQEIGLERKMIRREKYISAK